MSTPTFHPFPCYHIGMDQWVLVAERGVVGGTHVTVRRADGSTHYAAWECLRDIAPALPISPPPSANADHP